MSEKRKRSTIPDAAMDPLSAVLPEPENASQETGRGGRSSALPRPSLDGREQSAETQKQAKPVSIKKEQIAIRVSEQLAEEIRDCVVFLAGPPLHLTLSKLGEDALREKIEQLKAEQNNGEAFPVRQEQLKIGRPIR